MAQLGDWEALRRSIISSERGTKVLWPHPWAVPRAASWLAMAVAALLLVLPGFRRALRAMPAGVSHARPGLSESRLRELGERGEREHDARLIAFAALHLEDEVTASRLAERAIAMDASLTWIGLRFARPLDARVDRTLWIERLKNWDPDNAIPLLFEAEALFHSAVPYGSPVPAYAKQVEQLAKTTDWGREMQKAFEAGRYDAYDQRRFELDRSVLRSVEGDGMSAYYQVPHAMAV